MGSLVDKAAEVRQLTEGLKLANQEAGRLDEIFEPDFGPASRAGLGAIGGGQGGGGTGGSFAQREIAAAQRDQFLLLNDIQSKLNAILKQGSGLLGAIRAGR